MKKADFLKTINYFRRNGFRKTLSAVNERLKSHYGEDYQYVLPSESELSSQRETCVLTKDPRKISILVPAYETAATYLRELLDSVLSQSYPFWQLLLADASDTDLVKETYEAWEKEHTLPEGASIRYERLPENGGISENSNLALSFTDGDYVALLDHDDVLTPDALYLMAKRIRECEEQDQKVAFLYSDEDKWDVDTGRYSEPNLKPDYDPDYLLSNNYICHLLVMEGSLIRRLKFRREFDGSQDYDLILRAGREAVKEGSLMIHVPKVLYHWRIHSGSTAANPASKSYAYLAGKRALEDHLKESGIKATVIENDHVGFYQVRYDDGIFSAREDVGAYGGKLLNRDNITISGILDKNGVCVYAGLPDSYGGEGNRATVSRRAEVLDARVLILRDELVPLYEKYMGIPYPGDTDLRTKSFCRQLDDRIWKQRSIKLCEAIRQLGYVLLYTPEITVKQ